MAASQYFSQGFFYGCVAAPITPAILDSAVLSRLVKEFQVTGTVKDSAKSGRPRTATGEDKALVLLSVCKNPIQYSMVFAKKLRPYKLHLVHELNKEDFDRRTEFCEDMMEICKNDNNFARNAFFSDETTLDLNGVVKRHNSRYWSSQNRHWLQEAHTQNPQKLMFWQALLEDVLLELSSWMEI
ncbi:hypothetical protein NQ318_016602 [Aromia moschata]|uniref:Transposase n=1 Tax=Aromia moschata TaxID=1265417 RepID=A0AAV8XY46_9CUCU|nr:hypothetical protein NQ318_016602 [Aromia moschata]